MEPACIEYEVTEKDYIDYAEYEIKMIRTKRGLLIGAVVFSVLMFLIAYLSYERDYISILIAGIISVIEGAIFYFGMAYIAKRCTRWQAERMVASIIRRGGIEPQYFGRHRLEQIENGIELRYGNVCVQRSYAGIHKVEDYGNGILIRYNVAGVDFIPSAAFEDAGQRGEFIGLLQAKVTEAEYVDMLSQDTEDHEGAVIHELHYRWDEQSLIEAFAKATRLIYTTRMGWTIGRIISTPAGLILWFICAVNTFMVITGTSVFDGSFALMSIVLCFLGGFYCLAPLLIAFTPWARKIYKRQIDGGVIQRDCTDPQTLCLKEDRIVEIRRLSRCDFKYDTIYCVKYDAHGAYILFKGKKILPIPYSAFHTDGQKHEIVGFIKRKIKYYGANKSKG